MAANYSLEDATVEDKFTALQQWWQRHCKSFSEWYLSQSDEQQKQLIKGACPDIPETSTFSRQHASIAYIPSPTDLILPEFSLEGMLASRGRIFVLFMTRRLTSTDLCMGEDVKLLNDQFSKKNLPSFSNNQFSELDTPFVDPMDVQENIKSLSASTTAETRAGVNQLLDCHRLVHAEVWIALKLRRAAIATLLEKMTERHQRDVAIKPSPTYAALLLGELAQQAAACASGETSTNEENHLVEEN